MNMQVLICFCPASQELSCFQCLHDLNKPVVLDLEKHICLLCTIQSDLEQTQSRGQEDDRDTSKFEDTPISVK